MTYGEEKHFFKKINHFIEDATDAGTGNDKWDSTTVMEWECPADKRWILIGGYVDPDASATVAVEYRDSSDEKILNLVYAAAGTALISFPQSAGSYNVSQLTEPVILDAGEKIYAECGAAQGAGATASCVVLEFDV